MVTPAGRSSARHNSEITTIAILATSSPPQSSRILNSPLRCGLAFSLLLQASCGDPVHDQLEAVITGAENSEQALIELLMADGEALSAILSAAGDSSGGDGRAALLDVLARIYAREGDPDILEMLDQCIADPSPRVRAAAARALVLIGRAESIHSLLERLLIEEDEDVQLELLVAQEILDDWSFPEWGPLVISGGASLSAGERGRFIDRVIAIYRGATTDTLRHTAEELYEKAVAQVVQEADKLVIAADLYDAEEKYLEALALKPDSKNAVRAYGRYLYFDGGQPSRGLQVLAEAGMLLRIPRLPQAPVRDGDLSDPAWSHAVRIDSFYQSLKAMRVVPAMGRAEFYLGYTDDHFWAATKVFEEDTSTLLARYTEYDGSVWFDDSVCFLFDTDLDRASCYRFFVNSLGTLHDEIYWGDKGWNGETRVSTRVEPTFWTVEMEVPLASIGVKSIREGDVWIFNAIHVRAGANALPGAWTPTHGPFGWLNTFGLIQFE